MMRLLSAVMLSMIVSKSGEILTPAEVKENLLKIEKKLATGLELASSRGSYNKTVSFRKADYSGVPIDYKGNINFTAKMKDELVNEHNLLRNLVAAGFKSSNGYPMAQNMIEMKWDDTLLKHVPYQEDCDPPEDKIYEKDRKTRIGLNVADHSSIQICNMVRHYNSCINSVLEEWFNEISKCTYGKGYGSLKDVPCKYFMQLIWARAWKVACAVANCVPVKHKSKMCSWLSIVCLYREGFNEKQTSEPYVAGEQNCSNFKMEASEKYSHLCTTDKLSLAPIMKCSYFVLYTFILHCLLYLLCNKS